MTTYQEDSAQPISMGEDDVRQFMNEIRRFPLLTAEEERELAHRCATGDEEAIRQMVSCNLRLVVSVAREYAGRGVPLLDLIQEGRIGLLKAAQKFDHTLEFRFSTYADSWIRRYVTRYLTDRGPMVRVPQHTGEQMRKVMKAKIALQQENGAVPTTRELADYCQMPVSKVEKLLLMTPETCSLDAPTGEDDTTLGVLLEDTSIPQPLAQLAREEMSRTLEKLLSMLTDRQRQVLRLRFGMVDGAKHSYDSIGQMLEISKERVRQIERQAIEKLQKLGASMGLEDFLDE